MRSLEGFVRRLEMEAEEARAALEARRAAQERLEEALRGLGYEVVTGCSPKGRHEAVALYQGRMVGYGWGESPFEALRSLAGDLGLEARVEEE